MKAKGELDGSKEALNIRLWSDYNAQLVHMRAMKDILVSKLHTEVVPAQHNTRHKANVRQTDERWKK